MTSVLQHALKSCYDASRHATKMPTKVLRDLEQNTFVLMDMEVSAEEIPLLCTFLNCGPAVKKIETLIIARNSSGFGSHGRKCSPHEIGKQSALHMFNGRLFLAVIKFISCSESLRSVVIDNIKINLNLLEDFGQALSTTRSDIRWFSMKCCGIGDRGLRILTPHFGKMHMQVLALEKCNLTDQSAPYLASILRAQEAQLDTLYWNATLRSSPSDQPADVALETNFVFAAGLAALSVNGNRFSDNTIIVLGKILKKSLNFANNEITSEGMTDLVRAMAGNSHMHAILLGGNPGYDPMSAQQLQIMTINSKSRLHLVSDPVKILLERWIQLQEVECVMPDDGIADDHDESFGDEDEGHDDLDITDEIARMSYFLETAAESAHHQHEQQQSHNNNHPGEYLDNGCLTLPARHDGYRYNEFESSRQDHSDNYHHQHHSPHQYHSDALEDAIPSPLNSQELLFSRDVASNRFNMSSSKPRVMSEDDRPPSRMSMRPRSASSSHDRRHSHSGDCEELLSSGGYKSLPSSLSSYALADLRAEVEKQQCCSGGGCGGGMEGGGRSGHKTASKSTNSQAVVRPRRQSTHAHTTAPAQTRRVMPSPSSPKRAATATATASRHRQSAEADVVHDVLTSAFAGKRYPGVSSALSRARMSDSLDIEHRRTLGRQHDQRASTSSSFSAPSPQPAASFMEKNPERCAHSKKRTVRKKRQQQQQPRLSPVAAWEAGRLEHMSRAILAATNYLEDLSLKLRDATGVLSESLHSSHSLQASSSPFSSPGHGNHQTQQNVRDLDTSSSPVSRQGLPRSSSPSQVSYTHSARVQSPTPASAHSPPHRRVSDLRTATLDREYLRVKHEQQPQFDQSMQRVHPSPANSHSQSQNHSTYNFTAESDLPSYYASEQMEGQNDDFGADEDNDYVGHRGADAADRDEDDDGESFVDEDELMNMVSSELHHKLLQVLRPGFN